MKRKLLLFNIHLKTNTTCVEMFIVCIIFASNVSAKYPEKYTMYSQQFIILPSLKGSKIF